MDLTDRAERIDQHIPYVADLLLRLDEAVAPLQGCGATGIKGALTDPKKPWQGTIEWLAAASSLKPNEQTDAFAMDHLQAHGSATNIETIKVVTSWLPTDNQLRQEVSMLIHTALARIPLARRAES